MTDQVPSNYILFKNGSTIDIKQETICKSNYILFKNGSTIDIKQETIYRSYFESIYFNAGTHRYFTQPVGKEHYALYIYREGKEIWENISDTVEKIVIGGESYVL